MAEHITGNVTGKIKFSIDQKSWENLTRFQTKLTNIKNQLKGIGGDMKVNVVINSINKVANATVAAENKIARAKETIHRRQKQSGVGMEFGNGHARAKTDLTYAQWWKDELKNRERMQRAAARQAKAGRPISPSTWTPSGTPSGGRTRQQLQQQAMYNRLFGMPSAGATGLAEGSKGADYLAAKKDQLLNHAKRYNRGDSWSNNQSVKIEAAATKAAASYDLNSQDGWRRYKREVKQATDEILRNDRAMLKNKVTFASMRNELVQLTAAYSVFNGLVSTGRVGMEMESLAASAKVFAGSDSGVADHMKFITDEADRLGVNLQTATKEFTKFSIATQSNMSKTDQRKMFTGISEYAAVLGASQSDYERAFRAVQQVASKGQLYKEELDC